MFQLQSIENVVFLQKTEVSVTSTMQLIVKPGGPCFLGANAKQECCIRDQDVLPRQHSSIDNQGWQALHQIVDGFDLRKKRFQLIER